MLLKGIAASKGIVKAKVRLVSKNSYPYVFEEGEVLVTEITDPSMVPIIAKASAIITDIGGIMSHPAIVAREFGIPCIVGVKNATKILKNGQEVVVNGETGEIKLY